MQIPVDHLIYAAPDLDRGMREIERLTGIAPTLGGQHAGRGTRNALLALGADMYLEIVAPDPEQPVPSAPRWLGVDSVTAPRLVGWAARASDLDALHARAVQRGVPLGDVQSGARQRPDGVTLSWRFTDPTRVVADGIVPFFIDWGRSPNPARSAAQGASLVSLRAEHPDAEGVQRMLRALDLDMPVSQAQHAALVATIEGPHGRVELR